MVLAEALLRVPDAATADRLIEDKLAAGDWRDGDVQSTRASGLGLGLGARLAARVIHPGETPETILDSLVRAARPAGGARGDAAGDAAARLAFRARPDHRRGARRAPRAHARVPLFVRHAGRGRAHRGRRRALFRRLCRRDRGDRRARRQRGAAGSGPASRSSSRRCIRATRRCRASACWRSWCRALLELAQRRKAHDLQLHRRRRGGRPARTVARRDRRGAGRSRRSRGWDGFGLAVQAYQKRALRGDRLGRRTLPRAARPPADGAAGQGRLLGHRDQARAGARACRLSGVHPQGDDRPLLPGLRAQAARGARPRSIRSSPPTTR